MNEPGIYHGIPMSQYLALDAMSAGKLEWLAVSPRHYLHHLHAESPETDATRLGTALHMCVLEPEKFAAFYVREPDFGALAIASYAKPRATKPYREAVESLEADGKIVLTDDETEKVMGMAQSIADHPHARALLRKCPEREVTLVWDQDGRRCRGRVDMLGDGIMGELKTTRSLRDFSPFVITRLGYYRKSAWYQQGLQALGRPVKGGAAFYVAVENMAPYDVGVFVIDETTMTFGHMACETLLGRLAECEASGEFPGMFPSIEQAQITDAVVGELTEVE